MLNLLRKCNRLPILENLIVKHNVKQVSAILEICRFADRRWAKIASHSGNRARSFCTEIDYKERAKRLAEKELQEAIDIEKGLFEQSNIKYEPKKVSDAIRESHQDRQERKDKHYRMSKRFEKTKQSTLKSIHETATGTSTHSNVIERSKKKLTSNEKQMLSEIIKDKESGVEFMKLHQQDPRLLNLMTTVRSKKRRDKEQQIILEGRRLILEAFHCNLKLHTIIFSKKEELLGISQQLQVLQTIERQETREKSKKLEILKVPHHDLKVWSTLSTPPGLIAIFDRPSDNMLNIEHHESKLQRMPLTVICDNIREPNNLGSIIRTCAAVPCEQVIITKGCCDPWESKALRGGCGGHFRVPIMDDVEWERIPLLIPPEVADDCHIFIAENKKNIDNSWHGNQDFMMIEYSDIQNIGRHNLVIIGGETHGISSEAYGYVNYRHTHVDADVFRCI